MKGNTKTVLDLLRDYEAPNMLWIDPEGSWPIVWQRARGTRVWDADGWEYIDLTAAFGVAAAGHCNPRVVAAGKKQMATLLHAMGDVHPHALKAELARELSRITFERWTGGKSAARTMFTNSGFEAVEAALKTAVLATGKQQIIAFEGGYHGLGYGALNATHRDYFRGPFRSQLAGFGQFAPFPRNENDLGDVKKKITALLQTGKMGAIVVEPVQGRGGVNVPPLKFLPMLRRLCNQFEALLIVDEVFTGFGRTGTWFACEQSGTVPDVICLGKALTGGFPLSACVGRGDLMDAAWPPSEGEAIHTSTFQGHPVGCAMALAQIKEIETRDLAGRSAALGEFFKTELRAAVSAPVRGLGLMIGVEMRDASTAMHTVKQMLKRGFIVLPEGEAGNVISFSPPLTIRRVELAAAAAELSDVVK